MTDSEKRVIAPCVMCDERIIHPEGQTFPKCTYYEDRVPKDILTRKRECNTAISRLRFDENEFDIKINDTVSVSVNHVSKRRARF